ncbi:MAG: DMT family transporter [Saccharospirillaceae bacterium]|nr:DMT family transporter [Pseudomonadales bacterium]NRB79121.1 DMT family transporter [Saccharospirillaceae bacterium]
MKSIYVLSLLLLAAIWGSSFLFMRVAVVEFGPFALNLIRVGLAALILLPICLRKDFRQDFKTHWKSFMLLGASNYAIPFTLLSYTSLTINSGTTSLINATTPIFTAILGVLFFTQKITRVQLIGLFFGFFGIYIISQKTLLLDFNQGLLAIIAGLIASCGYGLTILYSKKYLQAVSAINLTAGGLFFGALYLVFPGIVYWPTQMPSLNSWLAALLLATLCTVIALIIFFQIIKKIGVLTSSSVTFLIPIFAILWGTLFLNEKITFNLIVGVVVIIVGTSLIIFKPFKSFKQTTSKKNR